MRRSIDRGGPASLRFSPTAWAKLLYLRDLGQTEIAGFGITRGDDLLRVTDIALVRQHATRVSVVLDDQAVADFFDRQVDAGLAPAQFARIWIHTHPAHRAVPSLVDEETFERVFGRSDWAVMFILARGGASFARLEFHIGPGGELPLAVEVDFSPPFGPSQEALWREEYRACVQEVPLFDPLFDQARGTGQDGRQTKEPDHDPDAGLSCPPF